MAQSLVYLDHNATTSILPEVLEAMLPYFRELWGNPSSAYHFGNQISRDIDHARAQVAALIGAEPDEIVFTSCGTESNNSALQYGLLANPGRKHIVVSAVEHSATMRFCRRLEQLGASVTRLPVSPRGELSLDLLAQAVTGNTAMVSLIWANNETGVLFPIREAAEICRRKGVLFHTDAVQALGKIPVNTSAADIDLLSLSGHKLHAPKGIGALYVRRGVKYQPFLLGGAQERGRRGGTENVPYIVGLGHAAELTRHSLAASAARMRELRDDLEQAVLQRIPNAVVNGGSVHRLPNTSNIQFAGVEAEGLLMLLDQAGICASSGSACTTGSLEPSHVLTAMGLTPAQARGTIRFSLGRHTTSEDLARLLGVLPGIIQRLRAASNWSDSPR